MNVLSRQLAEKLAERTAERDRLRTVLELISVPRPVRTTIRCGRRLAVKALREVGRRADGFEFVCGRERAEGPGPCRSDEPNPWFELTCTRAGCAAAATHIVVQTHDMAMLFPSGAGVMCADDAKEASRVGGVAVGFDDFRALLAGENTR